MLILDDRGPDRLTAGQRRDLMEIVDDRQGRGSILISSQLPVTAWHDVIDALIRDIAANPQSGMRLTGPLDGWLVRHGGRGHRLTIVFRANVQREVLRFPLVAFGG